MDKYDVLKIENQLCFPLYASAKEVIKKYKPYLDEIDLTYTQYITMMVLWEYGQMNVKELGERLYLDSGTLTPLLKKLESKGIVSRKRSAKDERNITVTPTEKGMQLREKAVGIPEAIEGCVHLSQEEIVTLYRLLYKVLGKEPQGMDFNL
ncbi:MAG: MarR family transcriptional regulator [Lachnospiraceae bacterium]|nr:MarR family transcriptional regulator [Lachnospiraceae bacterium]